MTTSTPIFPFAKPEAPPPPVIVILNATELHFKPSTSLLASEDLRPTAFKGLAARTTSRVARFHPYSHQETTATSGQQSIPTPTPLDVHRLTTPPPILPASLPNVDDPLDMSPLSSPESSPRSSPVPDDSCYKSLGITTTKIKIERPKGASRKNLQEQVKWDPAFLADIKKHTRQLVRTHLDDTLCFKDQEPAKLNLMVERFPRLDEYEYYWPLDIIIMGLLKYSSSHGKGVSHKNVVDTVREFVTPTVSNPRRPRRPADK